jgi:hypothetical protein
MYRPVKSASCDMRTANTNYGGGISIRLFLLDKWIPSRKTPVRMRTSIQCAVLLALILRP